MYTLKVSHSQIHQLSRAFDFAASLLLRDEAEATAHMHAFGHFANGSPELRLQAAKVRRELARAHFEAIEADGHGDEFHSEPLVGAELGDERDRQRAVLAEMDAEIARLEVAGPDAALDLGAGDAGSKWS